MEISLWLANECLKLFGKIVPPVVLQSDFMQLADNSMLQVVEFFRTAGYFLPMGTILACVSARLIFDHTAFGFMIMRGLVRLIRG